MNAYDFRFRDADLSALASGILWWSNQSLLCVSDLHLGKSERMARRAGALMPPYEVQDTLARLSEEVLRHDPETVICLGDSFDDLKALDGVLPQDHSDLSALIAGREWIWIEGNHDAGPVAIAGTHLAEYQRGGITFRHIADPDASAEVSGHYHPKANLRGKGRNVTRPCFLLDDRRMILPSFGTYTGGLRSRDPALTGLMGPKALAILTGEQALPIPMPR
jgi:DNA ligase-associated metallophosphoesterase